VWLGQVDVELPDGARFWHHVVRLHRAAMMVLMDGQDRVLLLWRHRFVQDRWGWELPGGLIDEGEEPAETAVRELEEETGYRAGQVEHLITFQPMVGMVDSEHVVFTGRDPEKTGEPTETTEVERMEWVPLASVPGMIAAGEIWNSGTLVALLRLLMPQG
jgi:8-oxo-dGTP pyrophosphatase MutT (NUDIX family)